MDANVIAGPFDGQMWYKAMDDGVCCCPWFGHSAFIYRWCANGQRWIEANYYRAMADTRCGGR